MGILEKIAEAVQNGDETAVVNLTSESLKQGMEPKQIINDGLLKGMISLGELFKENKVFVPEVLVAARALHGGLDIIKPMLDASGSEDHRGKIIIATVKGDLHDIGKNLVAMMLEGSGFEVIDLGIDVPNETIVEEVKKQKPIMLALSALLTTTMPVMEEIINILKAEGIRDKIKVLVGGAPVTKDYAEHIGADGYAEDAVRAAELARKLA